MGSEVPSEELIWQDPVPVVDHALISDADAKALKALVMATDLTVSELVSTAWASASTFRGSDMRGGSNGARVRLAPQKDWAANNPTQLAKVLDLLTGIQNNFGKPVSMADLIILAGNAGVEKAASDAGNTITLPFTAGRTDAIQEQTDIESFDVMEPQADGFRNFASKEFRVPAEHLLVDRAQLLTLSAPEMTVLVGGMRAMGANTDGVAHGILTSRAGQLTNDFFINLLDMATVWSETTKGIYEGHDRATGDAKWTGTRADLVFGSNSILRAVAEVYAQDDASKRFTQDFANAWTKVMNLGRFE